MTHCMIVTHRIAKMQVLQATVNQQVLLVGIGIKVPVLKDIPQGATAEQTKCATAAGVVYLNDVLDCLQLPTNAQAQVCINAAYNLYCDAWDACFPV